MTIRARVHYDWASERLGVVIVRGDAGGQMMAQLQDGRWAWVGKEPGVAIEPCVVFPGEMAEAVAEAFERHLATVEGYVPTEARKDYLAERARVDKFIEHFTGGSRGPA